MLTRRKLLAATPVTALGLAISPPAAHAVTYTDIAPGIPFYTEITWMGRILRRILLLG